MWVAIGIVGFLAVLVLLACIPLEIIARLDVYGKPKPKLRLRWFFGWFSKEIAREERKKESARAGRKRGVSGVNTSLRILRIVSVRGLWRQLKNLLFDLILTLKFSDLKTDFKIGLGDPAYTGFLFAFLAPAAYFINLFSPGKLNLQPSFDKDILFEGYATGKVKFRPVQLIGPALRFVLSKAGFRIVRMLVTKKWGRKGQ